MTSALIRIIRLLFAPQHFAENSRNLAIWLRCLQTPAALVIWWRYFDASFYLTQYPDARTAGVDPLLHFLVSGNRERRNPSSAFDSADYLARYPDVDRSGINPLLHFALWGSRESRECKGVPEHRTLETPAADQRPPSQTINNAWPPKLPLVSVVIPSFNYGHHLASAVDCVLKQTFENLEIIVVEGGSTNPESIIQTKQLETNPDPRTRVFFRDQPSLVGDNRNFGIQQARGRYICCLDADDLLDPVYLEVAVFLAEVFGFDAVTPSLQAFGDSQIQWIVDGTSYPEILERNQMTTVSLFRRSVWAHIGGFRDWGRGSDYVFEDWDFWIRLVGHGFRTEYIRQPLMFYRMHDTGLSSQKGANHQEALRAANQDLGEKYSDQSAVPTIVNRFSNLNSVAASGQECVLLAAPTGWVRSGPKELAELAVSFSDHGIRLVVLTADPNYSLAPGRDQSNLPTSFVYHLDHLFHEPEHICEFVKYVIRRHDPKELMVIDRESIARLAALIKQEISAAAIIKYRSADGLDRHSTVT